LLRKLLVYEPNKRVKPLEAMLHPFFKELRENSTKLTDGSNIPPQIFEFSEVEIKADTEGNIKQVTPSWYKNVLFQEKL
jgi:glycogen synthase kinase 3 beta